jgi:phosphoribosylglycinamide formyltransferase-1
MRVLGEDFTRQYDVRMINLHPSLLPLYKGLDTYNRALNAVDK